MRLIFTSLRTISGPHAVSRAFIVVYASPPCGDALRLLGLLGTWIKADRQTDSLWDVEGENIAGVAVEVLDHRPRLYVPHRARRVSGAWHSFRSFFAKDS